MLEMKWRILLDEMYSLHNGVDVEQGVEGCWLGLMVVFY
jgi:hypothetical protein